MTTIYMIENMEKIGIYEYRTEVYSLDFRGMMMIPTLLNDMLHAATCHAGERGYGYADMTSRNTTWVLSRIALEITDRKRLSEPILIHTWVESVERIFTYRCFEITTLDGESLGHSRSVWAAIDVDTRRPTSLEAIGLEDWLVQKECPVAPFTKILPAEEQPDIPEAPYKVKYSDLDINGHLNSVKYVEAMLDLFDIEVYRERSISRLEVIYQTEGRYGMELGLFRRQLQPDGFVTSICHQGKSICRAQVAF